MLQGDLSEAIEPYIKEERNVEKVRSAAADACGFAVADERAAHGDHDAGSGHYVVGHDGASGEVAFVTI